MTEYNPFAERKVRHPTTDFETIVHICKGSLGSGILAMPYAFKHIGLWVGLPGFIFVGVVCTYCIHMLVRVSQTLCFRAQVPKLNYAETAVLAFANDPKKMKKMGLVMSSIVNIFLVFDLLGCVCVYFVNVARSGQQILDLHSPGNGITVQWWILILASPMLFLCLIRNLKYLVPFSMIANIFILLGIIITLTFIFTDVPSIKENSKARSPKEWPIFFGTSLFAIDTIGIILPCENEMKTPEHFTGCPSVLVISMSFVMTLYTLMGFFGFLKYGNKTEANITLNLPTKNEWAQAAKLLVALAVFFSILLQFYVPIKIIWGYIKEKFAEKWQTVIEYALRVCLMILCALIAFAFPHLGPFLAFMGAVGVSVLGIILPAILDLIVYRIDPGWGFLKYRLIKDIFIILLGILGLVSGFLVSVQEFQNENK